MKHPIDELFYSLLEKSFAVAMPSHTARLVVLERPNWIFQSNPGGGRE
jgi:hypothetical protein